MGNCSFCKTTSEFLPSSSPTIIKGSTPFELIRTTKKTSHEEWFKLFIKMIKNKKTDFPFHEKLISRMIIFRSVLTRDFFLAQLICLYNSQESLEMSEKERLIFHRMMLEIIEKHLEKENELNHPLSYMIGMFIDEFKGIYFENMVKFKAKMIGVKKTEKMKNSANNLLKSFIDLVSECLFSYYELDKIGVEYSLSKENLKIFVTSHLFNRLEIREIIMFFLNNFRKSLEKNLTICKTLTLQDFMIPDSLIFEKKSSSNSQQPIRKKLSPANSNIPFSEKNEPKASKGSASNEINHSRLESSFHSFGKEESFCSMITNKENKYQENFESFNSAKNQKSDLYNSFESESIFINGEIAKKKPKMLELLSLEKKEETPEKLGKFSKPEEKKLEVKFSHILDENKVKTTISYGLAIDSFKKITSVDTPLLKMNCLLCTLDQIMNTIGNAYDEFRLSEKERKKFLTFFELFSIVLYIIVQSDIPELISHLKVIEIFGEEKIRKDRIQPFYFNVFKLASRFIENLEFTGEDNVKREFQEKLTEMFNSMKKK